jgi:hypothetical protein
MSDLLRLMGVGMDAEQAKRAGFSVRTATSAQGIVGPGNVFVYANADSMALSAFDPGDIVLFVGATACSVSPGATGAFLTKTTGSALAATAGYCKLLIKNTTIGLWTVLGLTA